MRSARWGWTAVWFAACAAGGDPGADVVITQDVMANDVGTVMDSGMPMDTGSGPADTGAPVDMGHDSGPTRPDTGPMCPSVCTTNTQCQVLCPTASPGYYNCCQTGSGGGSCSQYAHTCDTIDTPPGVIGAPCTVDGDCNSGGATCCIRTGSGGACGCMNPAFPGTCVEPPLCS